MNFIQTCALFALGSLSLDLGDAQMTMIGGNHDDHGCLLDGGYNWCEDTNSCVRLWDTPCPSLINAPLPGPLPDPLPDPSPDPLPNNCCGGGAACGHVYCPALSFSSDGCMAVWDIPGMGMTMDDCTAPQIAIDPMPPVMHPTDPIVDPGFAVDPGFGIAVDPGFGIAVDPGFGIDTSTGVSEGGRCASGFCEDPNNCPQCVAGLSCQVPANMMCAGTCFGTCVAIDGHRRSQKDGMDEGSEEVHPCSQVMCMMYCENGHELDQFGCPMCRCRSAPVSDMTPLPVIDPMPPILDVPTPTPTPELTPDLTPEPSLCPLEHVCPQVSVISENGIDGYTTYELSLKLKDHVKDIYSIFGDHIAGEMFIPNAYQENPLGSDFGGVLAYHLQMNPVLAYDSWLTVGITDGNRDGRLSSVGIDFTQWTNHDSLVIDNGAIFSFDSSPDHSLLPDGHDYVVAHLTLPNNMHTNALINAQGNRKNNSEPDWSQTQILFDIMPSQISGHRRSQLSEPVINPDCEVWNDGCNTCQVRDGTLVGCTRMMCFIQGTPHCLVYGNH